MTLTASSGKTLNPFFKMLFFTLKKNRAVILLGSIVSLLAMPTLQLTTYIDSENYSPDNDIIIVGLALVWIISLLMIAILSVINLGFLHSKKGSDVFLSLPLTRKELYLSRLCATIIGSFIPTVIATITSAITVYVTVGTEHLPIITPLRCLLFYFLSSIIVSILVNAFMLLTGHTFDAVLSFLGINLGLPILLLSCGNYAQANLFGISSITLERLAPWNLSPIGTLGVFFASLTESLFSPVAPFSSWLSTEIIVWLVLSIGILLGSLYFATHRKSEKAEESYAHPILPTALQLLIAVLVSFAAGEIFSLFDSFTLIYYIFATIGAMLAAVLLGAIIRRGFKGFKKDLLIGGCAATLTIIFGVSIMTGWFGFETRVPKVDDIKQAVVNYDYGATNLSDSLFTKTEDLENLTELHEAIIDINGPAYYSATTGRRYNNEFDENYDTTNANYAQLNIDYQLKNGQIITRSYSFYDKPLKNWLDPIMQSESFMNRYIVIEKSKVSHSSYIEYYNETEGYWESAHGPELNLEQAKILISAYRKDIQNGVSTSNTFNLSVQDIIILEEDEILTSYLDHTNDFTIYLNSSFENSLKVLKEFGFELDTALKAEQALQNEKY